MGTRDALQIVTPMPPLRTGIAQYSLDLLRAIDGRWPLRVVAEDGSEGAGDIPAEFIDARQLDPELPTIIQLGNSEYHRIGFQIGLQTSGIAVLHDVALHHGLLASHLRDRRMTGYWREIWHRYGTEGYEAAQALLRGVSWRDVVDFPLSERYIEQSLLNVVHNRFAERVVRDLVPRANVVRIPMGIPLPAQVGRNDARRALGWPESAFVIASISHINPNKRLPVVLRAVKRLASLLPETMFVVAGSQSPAVDVARQVRALGLGDRVILTGYVDEDKARLIAASSDACVNLRYPPTGETSASLLRLLGAGKPVLVTDGVPSEDLPPEVGLRVPVDRFEEEFIADLLLALAQNDCLREQAGIAGRRFVEAHHSMGAAVEGYRQAIRQAYGVELPALGDLVIEERVSVLTSSRNSRKTSTVSSLDYSLANVLGELGLGQDAPTLAAVSRAVVVLGLNRLPSQSQADGAIHERTTSLGLKRRLLCPDCRGLIGFTATGYHCERCGSTWQDHHGVPDFVEREE